MEVILLERVGKLGQMGEVVRVKDGFARNFLLPRGKALRATAENKARFEGMKSNLQARNLEAKGGAEKLAGDARRQDHHRAAAGLREPASSTARCRPRDIAGLLAEGGSTISRSQVALNAPIKAIGQYKVPLALHPEVETTITVIVARSGRRGRAHRARRGCDRAPHRCRGGSGCRAGDGGNLLRAGRRRRGASQERRRRRGQTGQGR